MFNLGPGELTVMALLAFLFVGEGAATRMAPVVSRWSWSDWLRLSAAAIPAVALR